MTRTAAARYSANHDRVQASLVALAELVREHSDEQAESPADWSYVGDLAEVADLLERARGILGDLEHIDAD